MSILVTIATYERSETACFLKDSLENEGIDCFTAFTYNLTRRGDEIRLQVKAEDVERTIQVMLELREKHGIPIEAIEPEISSYKILVPTDFSLGSEYACHYAIRLAQKLKAEIKVLHVYENPIAEVSVKESATFENYAAHLTTEMEHEARTGTVDFLQKMREYMKVNQIEDIKIHSSIVMGNIIRKIRKVSEIYKPDLMVLGTVGRREVPGSILAGVAEEIIQRLSIPVYTIPGPCSDENFQKLNVLYATDFNEKDNTSLDHLLKILEPLDVSITCIHIDTAHNPSKDEKMDELNEMLKKEYGQHEIRCRLIEDEDVYTGIKDFADQNNINLISFTTQKKGIFDKLFKPNLFKKILQESSLPILIFPG